MASVIRISHGGGAAVEESHLTIEQARSSARNLAAIGKPAECCWCVGLWDEEEEGYNSDSPCQEKLVSEKTAPLGNSVSGGTSPLTSRAYTF
jgi:hypothetical protein